MARSRVLVGTLAQHSHGPHLAALASPAQQEDPAGHVSNMGKSGSYSWPQSRRQETIDSGGWKAPQPPAAHWHVVLTHLHTWGSMEPAAPQLLPQARADQPPAHSGHRLLRALQQTEQMGWHSCKETPCISNATSAVRIILAQ